LPFEKKTWKSLDELDAGVCDGMTYEEIEVCLPHSLSSALTDLYSKSIPRITSRETRISSTTDTAEANRIAMWLSG